jgi:hypothetical protein
MGLREGKDVHALSIDPISANKYPPEGEPWGKNGLTGWGRQMLGCAEPRGLFLAFPGRKVPISQPLTQFRTTVQVEFEHGVVQVGLDCFRRDAQSDGDLLITIPQTSQGRDILLARRKEFPMLQDGKV